MDYRAKLIEAALAVGPAPVLGTGVVVLGMHRSGTSAVTRLINLLGVSVGDTADLVGEDHANRRGYWESYSLSTYQEHLLELLGGSWYRPPALAPGWHKNTR